MDLRLSYREGQFSPSETAAVTGLSLALQRDWRSNGYLRAREGGRASFSPRDLAEIKVMTGLRSLGVALPVSREVAVKAAPGVVFGAIGNQRVKTVAIDAEKERAERFIEELEKQTSEGYLHVLADIPEGEHYRYALAYNGGCTLHPTIDDTVASDDIPIAGLLNLTALGLELADAVPRPLFTLLAPSSFK